MSYSASEPWCNSYQASTGTCCQCITGYTGNRCETDINECVSSPCRNGATCVNLVNAYKCTCPTGYTGTNCDRNQLFYIQLLINHVFSWPLSLDLSLSLSLFLESFN